MKTKGGHFTFDQTSELFTGVTSKDYHSPGPAGRVVQSVGHLTRKSEVLGSIPGLATNFRLSFR